jgi:hypothetical protein
MPDLKLTRVRRTLLEHVRDGHVYRSASTGTSGRYFDRAEDHRNVTRAIQPMQVARWVGIGDIDRERLAYPVELTDAGRAVLDS